MHLKKLEIQGFKSFAEKTEIEFKDGITGIVGPNGSGKSNISDAIRWVLGEQSVKTLRGNKMEDIIFAGTDKRKPLGFSEVTITFDNKDGIIPIDYSEVSVMRRIFRSGESEYYLNKNSCRLKDIRELFMDTGVGKDGYSIIGQGRVDEILSTRSEDRRNIFEEAAGIVKYKARKEEGEKKLEKTNENLIRINDIIYELEQQLEPLKNQSDTAKEYVKLSNRLKDLEVSLFIKEIDRLTSELLEIENDKKTITEQARIYMEEKEKIENKYLSIKSQIEDMDNSIEELQNEKYTLQSDIERNENKLVLYEQNESFYTKEKERLENEKKLLINKSKEFLAEKDEIIDKIREKENELVLLKEKCKEQESFLEKLNEEINKKEKSIDEERNSVVEIFNQISEKKNKVNSLNSFKESMNKRILEIEKEIVELDSDKEYKEKTKNKLLIDDREKKEQLLQHSEFRNKYLKEGNILKEEQGTLVKSVNEIRGTLQGKLSNYNLLKNMEDDYEGYYKSVRNLLLASRNEPRLNQGIVGVVGELLKVQNSYEKAIEVALGSSIQNIVTHTEEDAKDAINYLRQYNMGRVTFLPISAIKGRKLSLNMADILKLGGINIASELVEFDEKYKNIFEYLLGRTLVVKDMDCGIQIAKKYGYSFRIVTLEGDVLNQGGSITGGSMSKSNTNILSRKTRIETLLEEINDLKTILKNAEDRLAVIVNENEKINIRIKDEEDKIQSINIEIINLNNEIQKLLSDIEKDNISINKYNSEISKLNEEKENIENEINCLIKEATQLEEGKELASGNIKEMLENFEKKRELKEQTALKVTDFKIEINDIENNLNSLKERVEAIEIDYENTLVNIKSKDLEHDKNSSEIDGIEEVRSNTKTEIDEFKILLNNNIEKLNKLKMEKDKFIENFSLEQQKLKVISEKASQLEKKLSALDVKHTKFSVQIENYNTRLLEDYELNYEKALEHRIEIHDNKIVNREIKEIKDNIRELGTVNLGAIEEYKRIKEKYDFMSKQREDLLTAKKSLNEVIKDMEIKMEEQFMENFDVIRKNFIEVFKELFGGGKADIYLMDEENILNSGIEIIAQPPGKKLQSLSLLSGGEKSLTAVALLFAILKTRPTPFCILDEIDAALDEANISRYTSYLKNFSDNTQFIMITHRKGTMEIADILYGVTMEEEGVSRLVSVKLSDKFSGKVS
ncbi:chromosome segregation protein SMC [Anaerosalibacter sp. Marseille-P3206]|uniref:chromosome segregation protein SMC n=1 Tax=Anaerosalibacter sp. Marseille-P3206 TaxID=1871005 RepID=UPI0013566DA1|nr:chromosome segregation protein SMC [Anaerosalibacter sp. Marseille-P3206]